MESATLDRPVIEPIFNPIDPRSCCNLMLDEADLEGLSITNLALQKLLYFVHAIHLNETGHPLVSGYFEAWKWGPVHPGAYNAFKLAGSQAITFRAEKQDPLSGRRMPLPKLESPVAVRRIRRFMLSYGRMSARQLVALSHAKNGPWDHVVRQEGNTMAFGLRITDNLIKDRFKFHKMTIGGECHLGDVSEDSPFI